MISKRIVLKFPPRLADQPIVCNLAKYFDLEFNILKAYIIPKEEGLLILGLSGEEENYTKGINYLKELGLIVQPLSLNIIKNSTRCTHCGVCITVCPTQALVLDFHTRKVHFCDDKCIACELCISACPLRAMEVHY